MFTSKKRLEKIEDRILVEMESSIESLKRIEDIVSKLEDKVGSDHTIGMDVLGGFLCESDNSSPSGPYKRIHLLAKKLGYEYKDVEKKEGFIKVKKGKK